ncbi:TetR/AcrR family transcriptional regulator [Geodermatophilaceae bacterium NBWT11]|nr:TetR/AcrR family transcriptional regulator [Geodermatophilaceae bacterium NBWT11]
MLFPGWSKPLDTERVPLSPGHVLDRATVIDTAAALIARHGLDQTTLTSIADASGVSTAAVQRCFGSKQGLYAAAIAACRAAADDVHLAAMRHPAGQTRDVEALASILDFAASHPGSAALMLTSASALATGERPPVRGTERALLQTFGIDVESPDPERLTRVVAALTSLSVLVLVTPHLEVGTPWRELILATCTDCLGHRS